MDVLADKTQDAQVEMPEYLETSSAESAFGAIVICIRLPAIFGIPSGRIMGTGGLNDISASRNLGLGRRSH
jgi:hypothetical protein